MRYLVLSDLHANWEALTAVLDDAAGSYNSVLCLGDLVGYGADPNAVVDWTRANVAGIVRGNHDKACVGDMVLEWFNPVAAVSAVWTMEILTPENREYLKKLPQGPKPVADFQILHGSPLDEDEYLADPLDVAKVAGSVDCTISFFGHTHLQGGFQLRGRRVRRLGRPMEPARVHPLELEPDYVYLINPGSTGQPRDSDPRAAYAIYDPVERVVFYHRVTYDLAGAQAKIRAAGLPDVLAERLAIGS